MGSCRDAYVRVNVIPLIEEFYKDPENMRRFEEWKEEREKSGAARESRTAELARDEAFMARITSETLSLRSR